MNIIKIKKITSLFLAVAILSTTIAFTHTQTAEAKTWYKLSTFETKASYYTTAGNLIVSLVGLAIPGAFALSKTSSLVVSLAGIAFTTYPRGEAYIVLTQYIDCKPEQANAFTLLKTEEKAYADTQHKKLLYSKTYTQKMSDIY